MAGNHEDFQPYYSFSIGVSSLNVHMYVSRSSAADFHPKLSEPLKLLNLGVTEKERLDSKKPTLLNRAGNHEDFLPLLNSIFQVASYQKLQVL